MLSVKQYAKDMGVTKNAVLWRIGRRYELPGIEQCSMLGNMWTLQPITGYRAQLTRLKQKWHHNDPRNAGTELKKSYLKKVR